MVFYICRPMVQWRNGTLLFHGPMLVKRLKRCIKIMCRRPSTWSVSNGIKKTTSNRYSEEWESYWDYLNLIGRYSRIIRYQSDRWTTEKTKDFEHSQIVWIILNCIFNLNYNFKLLIIELPTKLRHKYASRKCMDIGRFYTLYTAIYLYTYCIPIYTEKSFFRVLFLFF